MEKSPIKLIYRWFFNERITLYRIYLLAALQGAMYLIVPLGIQGIITYTMAGRFSASLILLALITILAVLFIGLFQLWQMRINETLHEKIFASLSGKISSFLKLTTPDTHVAAKINQFFEVVTLQKGISKILLEFSFAVISLVFGLIILPAYSSWFLLFTILMTLAFYLVINNFGAKAIESSIQTSKNKYNLAGHFQSYCLSLSQNNITDADNELSSYLVNRQKYYKILESQYKAILVFKVIFVSILLFAGAYLVQIGELNIGQFVASEIIILLVINAVEKIVTNLTTVYDLITALYKVEEIFKTHPDQSFLNSPKINEEIYLKVYKHRYSKKLKTLGYTLLFTFGGILILPWTQSIESTGKVTTLNPENRPQTINSRIAGRIEKWFVNEGEFVHKNDTIAFISEVKDDYFDPQLVGRSESQIKAKESSIISYEQKINAINQQVDALFAGLKLKTEQLRNKLIQAKNKVTSDSVEVISNANNYKVAEEQFIRYEELLGKGVISKTDVENRKVKVQDALAKKITSENKFINSKNELLNIELELNSIRQDYNEKLMKAESDKFSSMSNLYDAEANLTKMQGQLANYSVRQTYYYVLAPQNGYITRAYSQGLGEIVKEGSALCSIVPETKEQSVELYVNPIDLPLLCIGQKVQITFDGWPAFVFSGWPGISFGTYSAEITAIDRTISDNGKFRILAQNKSSDKWPSAIQIGGGVEGFALLNNVPLIYEFWRKINGFPPEFYGDFDKNNSKEKNDKKK